MRGPALHRSLQTRILMLPVALFLVGSSVPAYVGYRLVESGAERSVHERAEALWQACRRGSLRETGKPAAPAEGAPFTYHDSEIKGPAAGQADPYETQLAATFDANRTQTRLDGETERDGARFYVIAAPIVANPAMAHELNLKHHATASKIAKAIDVVTPGEIVGVSVLYVPVGGVYTQAFSTFWTVFKLVALLAVCSTALIWWYVHVGLVKPLGELHRTSQAIRNGDWGARYDVRWPDEIEMAALSFQDTSFWLRDRLAREEKLRSMFQQFVPASVAARALGKESDRILAGTRHSVSVMIINIRNFKLLMENLPPDQTVVVLNEFFAEVNKVIVANRGVVSKYLGDTVMAIFGMPVGNDTHALDAVTAAIQIPRAMQNLCVRLEEEHGWELGVGIGIATGEPIVGHFGSGEHMEYSLLGDVVVEAHRMEKMTKSVPEEDSILISEVTYRLVMSDVHVYDLGEKTSHDGLNIHPYVVQGFRSEARRVLAA